jgi:peptide-methionine (R)-S-oxide reductase
VIALAALVAGGGRFVASSLQEATAADPVVAKPDTAKPNDTAKPEAAAQPSATAKPAGTAKPSGIAAASDDKVVKTNAEWKKILTEKQYYVMRQKGTERAFTGEYTDTTTPGVYKCAGCGEVLFTSEGKFHSGCGWPSFYQPDGGLKSKKIEERVDRTHGMVRTEVVCRKCGAHLGHVFNDGVGTPTGMRYCINSVSLKLEERKPDAAAKPSATPVAPEKK